MHFISYLANLLLKLSLTNVGSARVQNLDNLIDKQLSLPL